jgi:hypothetical protein
MIDIDSGWDGFANWAMMRLVIIDKSRSYTSLMISHSADWNYSHYYKEYCKDKNWTSWWFERKSCPQPRQRKHFYR